MRQLQAATERDHYKAQSEENLKLKQRVNELEQTNQKRHIEIKNLEHELNEYSTYKSAYDYMKEELLKVKSEFHLQTLESEKLNNQVREAESKRQKIEAKYEALKEKERGNSQLIEML